MGHRARTPFVHKPVTTAETGRRTLDRYRRAMDAAAFESAFARHRHELHVHCYRMTGSFWDAEELTQLTFERAWRNRSAFEERASVRTWLYKIATNASLDHLKRHERRTSVVGNVEDILERDAHLQPYPDGRSTTSSLGGDPGDVVAARETTELFFVAALTALSPRRARRLDRHGVARLVRGRSGRAGRCLGPGDQQPPPTCPHRDASGHGRCAATIERGRRR